MPVTISISSILLGASSFSPRASLAMTVCSSGFLVLLMAVSTLSAPNGRIQGGGAASIEDFPFMGSLQVDGGGHKCGAIIISPSWVLTDAWCYLIPLFLPMYSIHVGSAKQDVGGSSHTVTQWIHHPRADVEHGDFDFALISVEPPFDLGAPGVSAVALPTSGQPTPVSDAGVVADWGQVLGSDDWATSELQYIDVQVLDDSACATALGANYTDRQLCAQNAGAALCYHDEGGPLVVDGTLLGVVLYPGYPCADPARIKTFARVAAVREWIRDVAGV